MISECERRERIFKFNFKFFHLIVMWELMEYYRHIIFCGWQGEINRSMF